MKICSVHLNANFAFIALQQEDFRKCWFFFSKGQGREIIDSRVDDLEKGRLANNDILCSQLPKDSANPKITILGTAAEMLTRLVPHIAEISLQDPKVVLKRKVTDPLVYFLFTPQSNERGERNGLMGCCDKKGVHSVFVIYSKKQGREILNEGFQYTEMLDPFYRSLDESVLPEEYDIPPIHIGDPIAVFLNRGYAMLQKAKTPF